MTTAYTSLLGLALPVQGELSGQWGDVVNNSITSLLDSAVAGTTNVSTDADVTLTTTTGAANTAREAILLFSGARTALRTVTAPAQSKIYTVINATTGGYSVKLVGSGPTTGVTIVAGESAVCAWNGSDFVKVSNTGGSASFTNVTVSGTTTLSGLTASTALALDASKNVVSVTNTGTGNNVLATSPTLVTPILGTPTSVTLTNATGLPLSTGVTGTLPTANGGTNLSSFTSGGVVYASSTSALATGSALTFDGTNLTATNGASIQGLTVGRGAGAVSTNTAVGASALAANTSGAYNTAGGANALAVNTSGVASTAFGYNALALSTGDANNAFGRLAMPATTSGTNNAAFGNNTLQANTTGSYNVALGTNALNANTTASNNTAMGYRAATNNTTGSGITAIGVDVLASNTIGNGNVGVGGTWTGTLPGALNGNTTGSNNTAMGVGTLASNTTGGTNTAMGKEALFSNTTASNNTAVGYQAGYSNTTGTYNTFVGVGSGLNMTTGSKNTIIGKYSGNQGGLDIRTASNYIVLSDGDGNPRGIFDNSGNLLVGTTTVIAGIKLNVDGGINSTNGALNVSGNGGFYNAANKFGVDNNAGASRLYSSGPNSSTRGSYEFHITDSVGTLDTVAMTLDASGNLLVGTTSAGTDKVRFSSNGASANQLGLVSADDASGNGFVQFRNSATTSIGSITRVTTTNAVVYNTTSDYRLKTVVGAVTGQGARIDALKPIDYTWKEGGQQARGFLAHEFQTVYANSVTGDKDAVDADGNPKYQSMQAATSEVIADLVAEIQSLRKRLATLESA